MHKHPGAPSIRGWGVQVLSLARVAGGPIAAERVPAEYERWERPHFHAQDRQKWEVRLEGDRDPASALEGFAGPLVFGPVYALTLCGKCQHR